MKIRHRLAILTFAVGAMGGCTSVQTGPSVSPEQADVGSYISGATEGLAIEGYDTVSYWTDEKAVKGSSEFSTEWAGTTWFFASQEHLDQFQAVPEKYTPEYGGHCALGVAYGEAPLGAGDAWTHYKDKLYLFGSKESKEEWLEENTGKYIRRANDYWPDIKRTLLSQQ